MSKTSLLNIYSFGVAQGPVLGCLLFIIYKGVSNISVSVTPRSRLVSFSASYVSYTTLLLYLTQVDARKNLYLSSNTATQLILQTVDIVVSDCTDSISAP